MFVAMLVGMDDDLKLAGYAELLSDLKARIGSARVRAALAVNRELVELYWHIGREILARQDAEGWGGKVIERLSRDLRSAFPDMRGLSVRNLRYTRSFAAAWAENPIVQQPAAQLPPRAIVQIPWTHNHVLLDKLSDRETRLWYAEKTIKNGWSRHVLALHIDRRLHERQGAALTNFADTLPKPQSDLAQELVKSEYNFDFLGIGVEAHERQIEQGLIEHVRRFLLELGTGFAVVGNQYQLEVGGEDFYIDLLSWSSS
jgi:predicted nuclease of restriction endonuclease-like (RecB) superfamily